VAAQSEIRWLAALAVDADGNSYSFGFAASTAVIVKLSPTSQLIYSALLEGGVKYVGPLSGIAVDPAGNVYVAGAATAGLPVKNAAQPAFASLNAWQPDAFVAKLDPTGSRWIYCTYLGGRGWDYASGIAVDAAGNAYVTGSTDSADFPVTPGALQPALRGGINAFFTKLDPGGAVLYSSYLGGSVEDRSEGISVTPQGDIYLAGWTSSPDFPVTAGAYQRSYRGGDDGFLVRLDPTGRLRYSTYLGGSAGARIQSLAIDAAGNAYVTGSTYSNDFPTTGPPLNQPPAGASKIFVTKLNNSGSALVYSTHFGSRGGDSPNGIAVDPWGNAVVVGGTNSLDFPTVRPFQAKLGNTTLPTCGSYPQFYPCADGFISKINASGTAFVYSSYLGGKGDDNITGVAVDSTGKVYITGSFSPRADPFDRDPFDWAKSLGSGLVIARIAEPPLVFPGLPEPEMRVNLQPGFYVSEVRLAEGERHGYWSMEASPGAGFAGGFISGGAIQDSTQPPGWAAFALARPATVRMQAIAQVLPGGDPAKFSMSARLLDANRNQIGPDQTGSASLQVERSLGAGFYILELRGALNAPLAAFQLGISADTMAGPAYAGGYIVPGLSGFGAFYLPQQQDVKIKASGAPANGPEGAGNLELRLLDANRRLINSAP
jgi:hypothetical protein